MKQLPEDIIAINDKIADAKELLRENGYYIYSIYHVDDVKTYFDCTDAEAMDVLDSALDNDATAETIWMAIRDIGDMMGLKEKKD
jgi:hypothetical protein|tara:strand:- start:286 stop:540 length:255 start_codon:yes stop_codon:yes gene_type:complete